MSAVSFDPYDRHRGGSDPFFDEYTNGAPSKSTDVGSSGRLDWSDSSAQGPTGYGPYAHGSAVQGPYAPGPAGYGPQTYGPAGFGPPMLLRPPTNPLAQWSMWLGIIGIGGGFVCSILAMLPIIGYVFSLLIFVLWLAPVAAVVLGHLALRRIRVSGELGRGQALAGLIIGYATIALILLFVILIATVIGFGIMMMGLYS